jgi:hypothetical protein
LQPNTLLNNSTPPKEKKEVAAAIGPDTDAPSEPRTEIFRVPSREELHLMIKYVDRSRIEPLYFGMDDLVKEVKVLSDKVKKLEEAKK